MINPLRLTSDFISKPLPTARNTILFFNENPLPPAYSKNTIAGKELRLRAAITQIDEVHVLAPIDKPHPGLLEQSRIETKIITHRLFPCPYYLRALPLIIQGFFLAKTLKPRCLEAESPIISGFAAVIVAKVLKLPSIVEVRTTFKSMLPHRLTILPLKLKRFLLNLVQRYTLTQATHIIANSHTYHHSLMRQNLPTTVINPGLYRVPPHPDLRLKPHSPFIIGYMGRLVPEKGITLLIDAVASLESRQNLPEFKVEIAGNGPLRSVLEAMVHQKQLQHRITFLGFTHNYTTLAKWDLLVNPCLVDAPLEMVHAEAAYMGVPVICFGTDKYPETVLHRQTGLKVSSKSISALAQAIALLIIQPRLWQSLSRQSQHFARKNYQFSTQVGTLEKLYHQLGILTPLS